MKKNPFHTLASHMALFSACLLFVFAPTAVQGDWSGDSGKESVEESCSCNYFQMEEEVECRFEDVCPPLAEQVKEWRPDVGPSPVRDDFYITVDGGADPSKLQIRIKDLEGFVRWEVGEMGSRKVLVSSEGLPPGSYLAEFLFAGEVVMRRRFLVYRK